MDAECIETKMQSNDARLSVVGKPELPNVGTGGLGAAAPDDGLRGRALPVTYRDIAQLAMAVDVAVIIGAALLGQALTGFINPAFQSDYSREIAGAVFIAALFVMSLRMRDLYEPMQLMNWRLQLRSILGAWCGSFLILASGLFAWRIGETVSRTDLVIFWSAGGCLMLAHRLGWLLVLPGVMSAGALRRRQVALLCFGGVDEGAVSKTLRQYGNSVQLTTTATVAARGGNLDARVEELVSAVRGENIDEIFIAADFDDAAQLPEVARQLRVLPQPVTLLPVGDLRELLKQQRADIGSTVAVELQRAPLMPVELAMKRTVDLVCAVTGLVVLSPLLVAAAIAVRLDSPGPLLFRQTRHGFNGRPFKIYKFRTMRVLEDGAVIRQATANDDRITKVGKYLRRYSVDELPQLLNVISGEMSIVGPRPHASAHDKHFSEILDKYAFRQHVKAGLTGWAQVQGARGETETVEKMQQRVDLDIWYINHWSLWLDFYIMLRTVVIVFTGENAH